MLETAKCQSPFDLLQRLTSGVMRTTSGVSSGTDGSGSADLVMPQPILVPRLGSTDEAGCAMADVALCSVASLYMTSANASCNWHAGHSLAVCRRYLPIVLVLFALCREPVSSAPTVSWQPVDLQRMMRRGAGQSGGGPPDEWAQPPTPQRAGESDETKLVRLR